MVFIVRLDGQFQYFSTVSSVRRFCVPLCFGDTEVIKLDGFLSSDCLSSVCEFMCFTLIKKRDVYFSADVK